MKCSEELTGERVDELLEIVGAFCEYLDKCPMCYRNLDGSDPTSCSGCGEYYGDCDCLVLTKSQIIRGEFNG